METATEIQIALVVAVIVFLLLALALLVFMLMYQRKTFRHNQQMAAVEKQFQEEILRSQIEVQEQTQVHIGRELHDNIGTLSSLVKMNLSLADTAPDAGERKRYLDESKDTIKQLITEIKRLALDLNTDRLSETIFSEVIEQDIERLRRLKLFDIGFLQEGEEWSLTKEKKLLLYRVCQEILHNTLKHANASQVSVSLRFTPESLFIRIEDNGIGFDKTRVVKDRAEGPGSGLLNLENRMDMIGGEIRIESKPGNGTKSYIQVPFIET